MIKTIVRLCGCALVLLGTLSCHSTNPPAITITEPASGALVPAVVRVRALLATEDVARGVRLLVNDTVMQDWTATQDSEVTLIWNTTGRPAWSRHELQAEIRDCRGRTGRSEIIRVTIAGTSGPTQHGGVISEDETWYVRGNPHRVAGTLEVQAALALEPGVVVQFDSGGMLRVGANGTGRLDARGADGLITFTSSSTLPTSGDWQGVVFAGGGLSVLDNCLIEYGGAIHNPDTFGVLSDDIEPHPANVRVNGGLVRMTDCIVRRSGNYGVSMCADGLVEFSGNTLTDNANCGLAVLPMLVPAIGSGNRLDGNDASGIAVLPGLIDGDVFWPNPGCPYRLDSTLHVRDTVGDRPARFTIGAGAVLEFAYRAGLLIDAPSQVVADGSGGMITLTGIERGYPDRTWSGITVEGDEFTTALTLRNCCVEGAGHDAAIRAANGPIAVTGTTIRYSDGFGVLLEDYGWFAEFRDNVITGCGSRALSVEPSQLRTIGPGNQLIGNDLQEEFHDGITVAGGEWVITSGAWRNCGVPYVVEDEIVLMEDEEYPVITVEPGTRFEFQGGALEVGEGTLMADGQAGRIIFTSYEREHEPGQWQGIRFEGRGEARQSVLRYCLVECGGDAGDANIICDGVAPKLEENEICYSSGYGVRLVNSTLDPDSLRAHNRFHDNALGDVGIGPGARPMSNGKWQMSNVKLAERNAFPGRAR